MSRVGEMVRSCVPDGNGRFAYIVTCASHGCGLDEAVADESDARKRGWHYDAPHGYGWICPDCAPKRRRRRPTPSRGNQ